MSELPDTPLQERVHSDASFALKPAARARVGRSGWLAIAVMGLIVAALFGGYWWAQQRAAAQLDAARASVTSALAQAELISARNEQRVSAMEAQLKAMQSAAAVAQTEQRDALARLDGISARVDTAVAAVSRAAQAQPSALTLKLDEVQFLLTQADERLSFAGDAVAASRALTLARSSLSAIEDASYAGFIAEIDSAQAALKASQPLDRAALAEEIGQSIAAADALRLTASAATEDAVVTWRSQLRQTLGHYFRIEREGAQAAARGLSEAELIAQIKAALRLARLSVLSADQTTYIAALSGIQPLLAEFDLRAEQPARLNQQLKRWQQLNLISDAPALTGLVERFVRLKDLSVGG